MKLKVRGSISSKFTWQLNAAYSPLAVVRDYDHHILRDKTATGRTTGDSFRFGLNADYRLVKNTSVFAAAEVTRIHAEGRQEQRTTDDQGLPLDLEIGLLHKSVQWRANIGVAVLF